PQPRGSRAPKRCFTWSPFRRRSRPGRLTDGYAELREETACLLDGEPDDVGVGAGEILHERPAEVLDRVGARLVEWRPRGDVEVESRVGVGRHAHPARDCTRGLSARPGASPRSHSAPPRTRDRSGAEAHASAATRTRAPPSRAVTGTRSGPGRAPSETRCFWALPGAKAIERWSRRIGGSRGRGRH